MSFDVLELRGNELQIFFLRLTLLSPDQPIDKLNNFHVLRNFLFPVMNVIIRTDIHYQIINFKHKNQRLRTVKQALHVLCFYML